VSVVASNPKGYTGVAVTTSVANAELIVRCVNEHEELKRKAELAEWLVSNLLNEKQLDVFYEPSGQAVRFSL
jgi:hypothetical protein